MVGFEASAADRRSQEGVTAAVPMYTRRFARVSWFSSAAAKLKVLGSLPTLTKRKAENTLKTSFLIRLGEEA